MTFLFLTQLLLSNVLSSWSKDRECLSGASYGIAIILKELATPLGFGAVFFILMEIKSSTTPGLYFSALIRCCGHCTVLCTLYCVQ